MKRHDAKKIKFATVKELVVSRLKMMATEQEIIQQVRECDNVDTMTELLCELGMFTTESYSFILNTIIK